MKEKWQHIVGYERIYQVSDYGRVKRVCGGSGTQIGRILKENLGINKRLRVNLYKNNNRTTCNIHRLVLEAFVGLYPSGMVTRHLDGNPQNNKLTNLKWGTYSENTQDSILIEDDVVSIIKLLQNGKTQKEIAKIFDITKQQISLIKLNKAWCHVKRL